MYEYQQEPSALQKLTGTIELTAGQAAVIKQTYVLLGVSVFCALAGGYIGATSETLARLFSGWTGWICTMLILNLVPRVAIACRNNPVLGVTALVADGFLSGLALAPILWLARMVNPQLILLALAVTAFVFIGVTGYVMISGRSFSAPKGLMAGMFFATIAVAVLNGFLQIGVLGILLSLGVGAMGVCILVYSTSSVLRSADSTSPIPGALSLFAGIFNIFVATLSIALRLMGGGRRS
jgi:FtsH-binding integral membrane protein